ncbi:MAG TPA: hypothetical protein VFA85_04280 [Terriglobales bacterium]|nr:hypothetical protein [Terriglobales bacterium]
MNTKNPKMTPEAQLLAKELFKHQKKLRKDLLVTYKTLCEKAHVPFNRATIGGFLGEIAMWCRERSLPPINALAINKHDGKPGYNYTNAVGCSDDTWPSDIGKCLTSRYPSKP